MVGRQQKGVVGSLEFKIITGDCCSSIELDKRGLESFSVPAVC